jgi:signal peptidase I
VRVLARRKSEESYSKRKPETRIDFKRVKKILNEGWTGAIFYSAVGIAFAFIFSQTLAFALSTDTPVVAVLSQSMQHDNAEQTYYEWLESRGYEQSEIESWPIPTGFLVGDMPIVVGADSYEVGDVIVYSVSEVNYPIIHRIIKINEDGTYQTKGDNNLQQYTYELSVKDEQIHGKVVFVLPKIGYFKVIATQLFGI